jgi:hypothetical protein
MPRKSPATATPEWLADALRDAPPILTIEEVSALTRLDPRSIRRFVAAGRIKTTLRSTVGTGPTGGSARLLFPRAEVGRFLTTLVQP